MQLCMKFIFIFAFDRETDAMRVSAIQFIHIYLLISFILSFFAQHIQVH